MTLYLNSWHNFTLRFCVTSLRLKTFLQWICTGLWYFCTEEPLWNFSVKNPSDTCVIVHLNSLSKLYTPCKESWDHVAFLEILWRFLRSCDISALKKLCGDITLKKASKTSLLVPLKPLWWYIAIPWEIFTLCRSVYEYRMWNLYRAVALQILKETLECEIFTGTLHCRSS